MLPLIVILAVLCHSINIVTWVIKNGSDFIISSFSSDDPKLERVYDDLNEMYVIKDEFGYYFYVYKYGIVPIKENNYKFNFHDTFKGEYDDIFYRKLEYRVRDFNTFRCVIDKKTFYVGKYTLMIFFYYSLPLIDNFYMIKTKSNYIGCPLYFSVDFNESITECNQVKWYHINDTYINNKTIQCIGASPYKLTNDKIVNDCTFTSTEYVCKDIQL